MQPVFEQLTEVGDKVYLQTGDGKQFKVVRCDGEEDSDNDDESTPDEDEDEKQAES